MAPYHPLAVIKILNFISRVFHTAAEGLSGEEGEEGKRKFFNNIKGQIDTVNEALNNVEKDLNQSINPPTTLLLRLSINFFKSLESKFPCNNFPVYSHLDSDSAVESFSLYSSLSKSYKWLDKVLKAEVMRKVFEEIYYFSLM